MSNLSSRLPAARRTASRCLLLLAILAVAPPAFSQQATITGTVVDTSGAFIARARVTLSPGDRGPERETQSANDGRFVFASVAPGPYRLAVTAEGFAEKTISGELRSGATSNLPPIALAVAGFATEVSVTPTQADIAEAQIKEAEKQRLLGVIPNYFVSYDLDAAPLNARQKLELTTKTFFDPFAFIGTGISAGIWQALNKPEGFGHGAEGYAKRYGAFYAEFVTGSLIRRLVMPTVFRQDPRYFPKATGSNTSRTLYAIGRSVICRGDNKRAQVCYSSLISRFAAGALANLYLPEAGRNSGKDIVQRAVLSIGGNALGNLFQEFIARRLTPAKE